MDKDSNNAQKSKLHDSIIYAASLTAALECNMMRQMYNTILNNENETQENLDKNHLQWETYLTIYTKTYSTLHKQMIQ